MASQLATSAMDLRLGDGGWLDFGRQKRGADWLSLSVQAESGIAFVAWLSWFPKSMHMPACCGKWAGWRCWHSNGTAASDPTIKAGLVDQTSDSTRLAQQMGNHGRFGR